MTLDMNIKALQEWTVRVVGVLKKACFSVLSLVIIEAQICMCHCLYGLTVNCNKRLFHAHFNKSMRNGMEQHKWSHRLATSAAPWLCVKMCPSLCACWPRCFHGGVGSGGGGVTSLLASGWSSTGVLWRSAPQPFRVCVASRARKAFKERDSSCDSGPYRSNF